MSERPDHAERMAAGSPGSPQARERGCRCPVLDNANGRGYRGIRGVYVYSSACPVHGSTEDCGE